MFHVVIPARYASTRFPGKMLAAIGGRPLIQWVWERARASGAVRVMIATDDARIRAAAEGFGADCVLTSTEHESGTDRVAEVARRFGFVPGDVLVNVQGDEPLIEPRLIADLAAALGDRPAVDIATAAAPIRTLAEFLDPNCVKALRACDGRALYFSRAPVPWPRDHTIGGQPTRCDGAWRHIGVYAYRLESLLRFAASPATPLEQTEKLEQLRALEQGMNIYLLPLSSAPAAGVDTLEDLERVRAALAAP